MHSPPQPDSDLKGAKARKMKVFDGYGSKKRHSENKCRRRQSCTLSMSLRRQVIMKRMISGLTSEGAEEEKQTGMEQRPWHCYHQPLIGTRSAKDSSTVTGQSMKRPSLVYVARLFPRRCCAIEKWVWLRESRTLGALVQSIFEGVLCTHSRNRKCVRYYTSRIFDI